MADHVRARPQVYVGGLCLLCILGVFLIENFAQKLPEQIELDVETTPAGALVFLGGKALENYAVYPGIKSLVYRLRLCCSGMDTKRLKYCSRKSVWLRLRTAALINCCGTWNPYAKNAVRAREKRIEHDRIPRRSIAEGCTWRTHRINMIIEPSKLERSRESSPNKEIR